MEMQNALTSHLGIAPRARAHYHSTPTVGANRTSRRESMEKPGLVILLLEDQENDILLIRRAALKANASHQLHAVNNGQEAVRYLVGEEIDRNQFPIPDLILTDLKMPIMDGLEFLRWRRDNAAAWMIPTIVLSGSGLDTDIREAYRLGASSYFTKPNDPAELSQILATAFQYWTSVSRA